MLEVLEVLKTWLKNVVVPESGMARFTTKYCLTSLLVFLVILGIQWKTFPFEVDSSYESAIGSMQLFSSYSCTVYFTIAFLSIISLFCNRQVHYTVAMSSLTISSVAGISHLILCAGLSPLSTSNSNHLIIHIRWAEWFVCVPLLLFVIGHITQVRPKFVFLAMAAQALVILLGYSVEVVGGLHIRLILFGISLLIYVFIMACIYVVAFQLGTYREMMQQKWAEAVSAPDEKTIKILGFCIIVLWISFPLAFALNLVGLFSERMYIISGPFFDAISKGFFLGVLSTLHFKLEIQRKENTIRDLVFEDEKQSKLLRFVYHEVLNPLNSIMLALDLLETDVEQEHSPLFKILKKSATAMFRVMNDIVELAKHQGGLKLQREPIDIRLAVDSLLSCAADSAKAKSININFTVGEGLPSVILGDLEKVQKMFSTLLSNAIKFSPPGTEVDVVLLPEECFTPELCTFRFSVKDSGPGIPAEIANHLFEPFGIVRPGDFSQDDDRGSGLSLCMLKHLADLMHAEVKYTTSQNQGTTFTIVLSCELCNSLKNEQAKTNPRFSALAVSSKELKKKLLSSKYATYTPITEDNSSTLEVVPKMSSEAVAFPSHIESETFLGSAENKMMQTPEDVAEIGGFSLNSTTFEAGPARENINKSKVQALPSANQKHTENKAQILVVDDVLSNAKLASMIFKKNGFPCDMAFNGQEAVDMAIQNDYKLILMDNVMPVMTGVEATRQILACKNVVIIGITGNVLQKDIEEFLEAGAIQILKKPANKTQLVELCEVYIHK